MSTNITAICTSSKALICRYRESEVIVIIGPSGSGKSTFLRSINHLEKINQGRIKVCGHYVGYRVNEKGELIELSDKETSKQRREVGMVFQQFNLFPIFLLWKISPLHPSMSSRRMKQNPGKKLSAC